MCFFAECIVLLKNTLRLDLQKRQNKYNLKNMFPNVDLYGIIITYKGETRNEDI